MRNKAFSLLTAAVFLLSGFAIGIVPAQAAASAWPDKGVSIQPRWNTDFSSQTFQQSVRNAAAVGVNNVTLVVPYCQSNVGSTDIGNCGNTPTDQSLIDGINFVKSLGMKVTLKVHDFPNDGQWSAFINPGDRGTWFANYSALLNHLGTIAQQHGVYEIVIGNELLSMTESTVNSTNTQNWVSMIGNLRRVYSGRLSYGANWGGDPNFTDEKDHIDFWGSLDDIGISGYFNLSDNLQASWSGILTNEIAPLHSRFNKPILFTEIGYKALDAAHQHPWMWWQGGSPNLQEQANDYDALFSFWGGVPYFSGVSLWQWSSDPNAGGVNDGDYTPQGKPAQDVMAKWFAGNQLTSTTPPPNPTPTPTPNPTPAPGPVAGTIDIWWPTTGSVLQGVQPFKAMLTNNDVSVYTMYWQVDGDRLNLMANNSTDWPHKESLVDVSGWNWRGAGPYQITFVAKDLNGNIIAQRTISITVAR